MNIIVSIWQGEPNKGIYLGCGVCIENEWILTAKHVVLPTGVDLQHNDIRIGLIPDRDSGISISLLKHHPDRDVSLLKIARSHNKQNSELDDKTALSEGEHIELLAYNSSEKCIKGPSKVTISNWTEPDGWEFHTIPSHGMSGGAVLIQDKLVGIIQARDEAQNSGIIIPLKAIMPFIKENIPFFDKTEVENKIDENKDKFEKEDEEFLKKVQDSILEDLQRSQLFQEKITSECGIGLSVTQDVVDYLIKQCESGIFDEVVRNSQAALTACWREINKDKNNEVDALFKASDGLVSKLALYNVNKYWFVSESQSHQALTLPKMNLSTLEVFISRYSRTIPSPKKTNTGIKGVYKTGNIYSVEHGIKTQDAVVSILKALAATFLCYQIEEVEKQQFSERYKKQFGDEISKTIGHRKKHKRLEHKQCCFILIPIEDNSSLQDPKVQEELKNLIPNLEWVTFIAGNDHQVFIIDDTILMIALKDFYSTLDKLEAEWVNIYRK